MRVLVFHSVIALFCTSLGRGAETPPELPAHTATKGHDCYVSAVTISRDGKLAASADMKGNVSLWQVGSELSRKGTFRATSGPGVEKWVWSAAISPDGKFLAAGSDDETVWLWDIEAAKLVRRVRGHSAKVDHVFFLPDGKKGVSIGRSRDGGGSCLAWDVQEDSMPRKMDIRASIVALSPDGEMLCFSDGNMTVLYDLANGKKFAMGYLCDAVAFSPDSKQVVKGTDYTVQVWDTKTRKERWASKGHNNKIKHVLFTPNGKRFLSMDGVRLHIWDADNGDEIGRYKIGGKTVASCFACAPDGKSVLVGDREGGLTLHALPK